MRINLRKSYGDVYLKLWVLKYFILILGSNVMKKRRLLKWFTLIEMLIVIVIIWILSVVLTESYITISKIALKVEQEKHMSEESLILTQVFQSISDEATIDFDRYKNEKINLKESKWFVDVLYLTGGQWSWTSIYTTGGDNCLDLDWNFPANEDGSYPDYSEKVQNALSWCMLVLEQASDKEPIITPLTTPWKVIISKVKFRVIPYDSDNNYFDSDESDVINEIHQPAFRLFIHLYAPLYQPVWTNNIHQPLQLFFNLNL